MIMSSLWTLERVRRSLLTYVALFGSQVIHRSVTTLLHASRSPTRVSTSAGLSAFTVISPWIVRCHVSFGRPTLLLVAGFQRRARFCVPWSDILRPCQYHLQQFIFSFSITLCYIDLCLSSSSLTISYHLIFMIVLRHPLSNLLILSSI